MEQAYRPHFRYALLTGVAVLFALLFARNVVTNLAVQDSLGLTDFLTGEMFFGAACIGLALWNARLMLSRVLLGDRAIAYQPWGGPLRRVEFRQLMSVSESGRAGNAIILLYHPTEPSGLLDLERVDSLVLPAVTEQNALLETLEAHVPQ